MRRVQAFDG